LGDEKRDKQIAAGVTRGVVAGFFHFKKTGLVDEALSV